MKPKLRKVLMILSVSFMSLVVALVVGPIVLLVVCWEVGYRPKEVDSASSGEYKVYAHYIPGGLNTNSEVRVYTRRDGGDEQLLLFADGEDTASVFFADSVTAAVVLYGMEPWEPYRQYPADTYYFKLNEKIQVVWLP